MHLPLSCLLFLGLLHCGSSFVFQSTRPTSKSRLGMVVQARDEEASGTLTRLLDDESFAIEFRGYLSNHSKHAVIALAGLQASAEEIQRYWDQYTTMTPYNLPLEPAEVLDEAMKTYTPNDWQEALGKKVDFPALCAFFDQQEREIGTTGLMQLYAPVLLEGLAGALTHGVIHLGWALDACNRHMTVEGLAYMVFSYISVGAERFTAADGTSNPVASLLHVADEWETQNVKQWVEDVKAEPKYSEEAGFHTELASFSLSLPHSFHLVLNAGYPLMLAVPSWMEDMEVGELLEQLYKAVTLLYLGSAGQPDTVNGNGDFVVLHLLTSLWAVEQIITLLPEDQQRKGLKCFWSAMIGLLFTSSHGFPARSALEGVSSKFASAVDDCPTSLPKEGKNWEELVPLAIAEEEEHNIKLVYVTRELWKRYGHWTGFRLAASSFTLTPNIGPAKASLKA
ncbi:unnamed protein product [Chrysoparadoxa australica]